MREIHAGLIEFFARQRALIEKLLAALIDFLLRIQRLLGLLRVRLCLLDFFRQIGGGGRLVSRLGLIVSAFCVLRCGGEIAVLQHREQFSFAHRAAALHQKFLYWSADLRHDGGLLPREQNCLCVDNVLNLSFLYRDNLHGDCRFLVALVRRAAGGNYCGQGQ